MSTRESVQVKKPLESGSGTGSNPAPIPNQHILRRGCDGWIPIFNISRPFASLLPYGMRCDYGSQG
jgi:hypothetical protein